MITHKELETNRAKDSTLEEKKLSIMLLLSQPTAESTENMSHS